MNSTSFQPRRIGDVYGNDTFELSIEIFPPKTPDGDAALFESLDRLAAYRPAFITCTYGAGGSTQARTAELCSSIQQRYQISTVSHLTCVGSTKEELVEWLGTVRSKGIGNIMALRGDPPAGETEFQQVAGGLQYANQLVQLIRDHYPETGIGVAGYPEKHQECPDAVTDLDNLKRKVETGADAVFTQLFFENGNFFDFRDRCQAAGIDKPIVPGIMPITNFARIQRITKMCGAYFPSELSSRLEAAQEDNIAQFEIGVEHAIQQCRELMDQGAPGIHFYALNRSQACERILEALNFQPAEAM